MSYRPSKMKTYDYASSSRNRFDSSYDKMPSSYATKKSAYTPEYTLNVETSRASPDLDRSYDYTSNYVKNYPSSTFASNFASISSPVFDRSYGGSKRPSVTSDYSSIGRTSARQSQYTSRYNSKTSVTSDYSSMYRDSPPPRSPYHTQHKETSPVNISELVTKLSVEDNHRPTHDDTPSHGHHQHGTTTHVRCNGVGHHHHHHNGECDHKNTPGYLKHRYGEDAQPDEVVSLRHHTEAQTNGHDASVDEEKKDRRPRSRRTQVIEETKTDSKPTFKSRFAREVKMGGTNVSEPGKWVGSGFQLDSVLLTADKGHLIWTEPKGKMEVVFKYGHYNQNFSLFMDPQFKGVKVCEVKSKTNTDVVIDGREDPWNSKSHHHVTSAARNKPENNFEFKSRDGKVTLLLEALRGADSPKANLFKLNYTMAL